ncbi:ATP-binding cassette subfamily B protein [Barrientosiimonas humi]|uniref:ATP-binding cassette subfamily B protein n=1 Tax=Barrientosiimonas humi TaxID=999931 RepID=A0A542XB65_9MICO|nr:ATP-binding cassette subfamily B protein [Barrientosiimonas humi]CAG7573051.1 Putative multidrug export ATP-binding/permease protein [Barrientosiimonas humi]
MGVTPEETSVRSGVQVPRLRPAPRLAPPGKRQNRATALLRLPRYLGPYRARWFTMLVFSVLVVATSIVIPLVTRAVIDGPIAERDQRGLLILGTVALALGVLEAVFWFIRRWVVARATLGVEADLRKDLYAQMQLLPMGFHSNWQSGQLLSRIMTDLSMIRRFLGFGLVFLILNFLQIVVVTGLLLAMYWPLGLVVLVSTVPIVVTVLRNQTEYTRLSRLSQDQTGDVASTVEESALGLRVIKAFGRDEHAYGTFDRRARTLFDTQIDKVNLKARFWTLLEIIPNATLIIVLGLGAVAVGQGRVTLGTLVAFITMMLSLVWPISSLGFLLSMTQESMTAADRIVQVFDEERTIDDGDRELAAPQGHLRLENVGFRFPDARPDEWTLRGVDLDLQPGETVALVGATGSGKSLLTALVPRLYDVTEGRILLDGVDIRDLTLPSLRSAVATAFEDPTLFSMSVRENLTLGRPDATDAEVEQAIEVAQAHFVHELPYGLDTRIGEQGMSLSGGQRQRLSLARAVLAQPAVIVLDDTLSALDVHTEALVEASLRSVLAHVTGIVVAHRASTVLLADKVALLERGTITHVGTHAELLATVPAYRHLLAADGDERPAEGAGWHDHEGDTRAAVERSVDRAVRDDEGDAAADVDCDLEELRR